jgi:hypothetical protein
MAYTPPPSKIVTQDKLAEVDKHIAKLKAAMHEQDLAVKAGIGDPAVTQKLQDAMDKIMQFKRVYFPGQ